MINIGKAFFIKIGTGLNYLIELIVLMMIFSLIGILVQSEFVTSFAFVISAVLTLIVNFIRLRPLAFYIITVPIMIILMIFIPKVLV